MNAAEIAELTEELRRLVAWPTQNVTVSLRQLSRVVLLRDPSAAGRDRQLHASTMRLIAEAVGALEGELTLLLPNGRLHVVEAAAAKEAYRWLFWLGRSGPRAPHESRRSWAIEQLGMNATVAHWRRDGPEAAFLTLLAEHLLVSPEQPDRYMHEAFDLTYAFDEHGRLAQHNVSARLRALREQTPHSELTLVTDSYPGHRFTLNTLLGCVTTLRDPSPPGLPLRVDARGPAVQAGDTLDVSALFEVEAETAINHVAWTMGGPAEHASVRLRFDAARPPSAVWGFSGAHSPEEGMVEAGDDDRVRAFGDSYYRAFPSPARHRWFGLSWTWPL